MKKEMIVSVILVMVLVAIGVFVKIDNSQDKVFEEDITISKETREYLTKLGYVQDHWSPDFWKTKEGTHWEGYEVHSVYNARTNLATTTEIDLINGESKNFIAELMDGWFLILEEY